MINVVFQKIINWWVLVRLLIFLYLKHTQVHPHKNHVIKLEHKLTSGVSMYLVNKNQTQTQ